MIPATGAVPVSTEFDPTGSQILTSDALEAFTAGREFDDALVFETSGSTGDPKRIPLSPDDQYMQAERTAKAFRMAGMTEEDGLLNLGAPMDDNHISGWIYEVGAKALDATVYNSSAEDVWKVFEQGDPEEITAVACPPLVMQEEGKKIEAEYGAPLTELFPNMRVALPAGDLVTDGLRQSLKEQWGFDIIHDTYATTEFGYGAVQEDEDAYMTPLTDELTLEIAAPEDQPLYEPISSEDVTEDDIYDITDLTEPRTGQLLVTDLDRKLPLIRYNVGDIFKAVPTDDGPRFAFKGRTKDTLNPGGAPLYMEQIDNAVSETYPEDTPDWKLVMSRTHNHLPGIDVYPIGDYTPRENEFRTNLFEQASPVKEAYNDREVISHIDLSPVESVDDITQYHDVSIDDTFKADRVLYDASWGGRQTTV